MIEVNGGDTSMFDPQGLQPEKSLNALLAMNEARTAFGESGTFEFEDLLEVCLSTDLMNLDPLKHRSGSGDAWLWVPCAPSSGTGSRWGESRGTDNHRALESHHWIWPLLT